MSTFRTVLLAACIGTVPLCAQRTVTADGQADAYTLITNVLGALPETPDCGHREFGQHITQAIDADLGKSVFVFNIHVTPDTDRCLDSDHQGTQIKTDTESPAYNKAFLDDTVTYRWKFRLPSGFQPSIDITHIHQLKAGDGDDDVPIITLTPRRASTNMLQVAWSDGKGEHNGILTEVPLSPFLDTWVEAYEKVTVGPTGRYSITIRRVRDGAVLLAYANTNLDLWRTGTTFVLPKWGIYRSLNNARELRDEQVRFDRICLAKGNDECPEDRSGPTLGLSVSPATRSVAPGAVTTFVLNFSKTGGTAPATFTIAGLPASALGTFSPRFLSEAGSSTLSISTSAGTPPGTYALLISADNAAASKTVPVSLTVLGAAAPSIRRVFNAASYIDDSSGPAAWISIAGTNLSILTRSWNEDDFTDGKLPTELNSVSVTVDGKPAAVSYISPTQINVQVPNGITLGVPTLVQVTNPRGKSSVSTTVDPFAPGLFRLSVASGRYPVAQHSDFSLVGRTDLLPGATPAQPGEMIILYGTGFGPTTPPINTGELFTQPAVVTNSVRVRIGNRDAEMLWAGLISAGLYQFNVKVPENATTGDAALLMEVGGVRSQQDLVLTIGP